MPTTRASIRCMAVLPDEDGPSPLFLGRDDGTVEGYRSARDADLGLPSLTLRGHQKAVTGLLTGEKATLLSCSLDGTLREWRVGDVEGEGGMGMGMGGERHPSRVVRVVALAAPLYCVAQQGQRLYLGGGDGALYIVDGERRSTWRGHRDTLACIAFAEDGGVFVTGGYDHQLLVWDTPSGRPIRRLIGHANRVVRVCVVSQPALEDERADRTGPRLDGAIVSFAKDRTMKVWLLPSPEEEFHKKAEDFSEERASSLHEDISLLSGGAENSGSKMAALESTSREGVLGESAGLGAEPRQASPKVSLTPDENVAPDSRDSNKHVFFMHSSANASSGNGMLPDVLQLEVANKDGGEAATLGEGSRVVPNVLALKSALKPREPALPLLPLKEAVGTIELPEIPFVLFQPPAYFDENDDQSQSWSSMALVGASNGYVWGMNLARLTLDILLFVRENHHKVSAATLNAKRTLRENIVLLKKSCRKQVLVKKNSMIEVARKRKQEEVVAARAARLEQRRKDFEQEEAEEDGEGFLEGNEEIDLDMGYEEDEEEEVEGVDGSEDRLRHLTSEEKAELEKFIGERETERDMHIKSLQSVVSGYLDKLLPLARTPYTRSRDQFYRLRHISAAKAGCETVLAVVRSGENVYAAQDSRVVVTQVTPGLTIL